MVSQKVGLEFFVDKVRSDNWSYHGADVEHEFGLDPQAAVRRVIVETVAKQY